MSLSVAVHSPHEYRQDRLEDLGKEESSGSF